MAIIIVKAEEHAIRCRSVCTVVRGTSSSPQVYTSDFGLLICATHNSGWCQCIKAVIMNSEDSFSIPLNFAEFGQRTIFTPILPDFNIYASVALDMISDSVFKVNLNWPQGTASPYPAEPQHFIGMIGPGDGRVQIRQMVIAWMEPMLGTTAPSCKSGRHSRTRHLELKKTLQQERSGREKLAHVWYIKRQGKCSTCFMEEGSGTKFDDDLIPKTAY